MGRWKSISPWSQDHMYKQIVREGGFILTRGAMNLSFGDPENHALGGRVAIPSFQLLKVHKKHPMRVIDSGKITIRPQGDTRLMGRIVDDPDPTIYDSASVFVLPFPYSSDSDRDLNQTFGGVWELSCGMKREDRTETGVTVLYHGKRGLSIDGTEARTWSVVTPSQIPDHLFQWFYQGQKINAFDQDRQIYTPAGRFEFPAEMARDLTTGVSRKLEKRFKTRMIRDTTSGF
ncbi:MAG: hypothetical protein KKF56_03565 [Nanoarchaeota archaeon]|nr:hypothetical protein [Nanoarchaeota archaeon]